MIKKRQRIFRRLFIFNTFMKIVIKRMKSGEWPVPEITPEKLFLDINDNQELLLLYVLRIYGSEGVIPKAITVPPLKLVSRVDHLEQYKDKKIVTVCGGGGMSMVAAEILIQAGFKDVKSLNGGMDLWAKKGYPTTKKYQKLK